MKEKVFENEHAIASVSYFERYQNVPNHVMICLLRMTSKTQLPVAEGFCDFDDVASFRLRIDSVVKIQNEEFA